MTTSKRPAPDEKNKKQLSYGAQLRKNIRQAESRIRELTVRRASHPAEKQKLDREILKAKQALGTEKRKLKILDEGSRIGPVGLRGSGLGIIRAGGLGAPGHRRRHG